MTANHEIAAMSRRTALWQRLPRLSARLLSITAVLGFGCSSDPEVKGNTARVVGEWVTLNLAEGKELFSADVELISDADAASYDSQQLRVRLTDGRQIVLLIPAGVTAGPARLRVGKDKAGDDYYEVPLTIDRLVGFANDAGQLHLVPLPPSTAEAQVVDIGKSPLVSLSDDATTIATASADQLHLIRVSTRVSETRLPAAKVSGPVKALAALPSAAIVATANDVAVWEIQEGAVRQTHARPLKGVKAMAALDNAPQAPLVAVLSDCENGGDCIALIDFRQQTQAVETLQLDSTSSARSLALSSDGRFVTVADSELIYGVSYASDPPEESSIPWGSAAEPTSITRTRTLVSRGEGNEDVYQDIFAVGDRLGARVLLYGAPSGALSRLNQQPEDLDKPPLEIAFGPNRQIYVLNSDRRLVVLTVAPAQVTAIDLAVPAGATGFVVQR